MGGSARLFFVTIILFSLAVPLNFALSAPKQPSAQACVPPPQGIVNWWPGNYTAADIIGGNTGTWQGSVGADYTTGRVDGTFRTSRYSNLAFSNNFIFNNPGNATIEFWIYPYYAAPKRYSEVKLTKEPTPETTAMKVHVVQSPAQKSLYRLFPSGGIKTGEVRPPTTGEIYN